MDIFLWSFIILTILHPIGDFSLLTSNRKLHYLIVLNPLHFLWDISPFRQHHKYVITLDEPTKTWNADGTYNLDDFNRFTYQRVHPLFWRWLAVDQLGHVLLNLIMAWFLEVLF